MRVEMNAAVAMLVQLDWHTAQHLPHNTHEFIHIRIETHAYNTVNNA